MRSNGWGPNPLKLVSLQKDEMPGAPMHSEKGHLRTQGEGGCLEAKERSLRRNQSTGSLILDFRTVSK